MASQAITILSVAGSSGSATGIAVNEGASVVTFQATAATGTGTAAVVIQVSNDGANWLTLGTLSLTLSGAAVTDGFAANSAWVYTRATISGSYTGTVTVVMGI